MPDDSPGPSLVTADPKPKEPLPQPPQSGDTATARQDAKPGFGVADIVQGSVDLANRKILYVYAKAPPRYAVYLTDCLVVVQYADDTKAAETQRKNMASLNALRAQIEGLIDGWRTSRLEAFRRKARKYDGRVAAALIYCLEDDSAAAQASLSDVKDDLVAERTSWGRFEYLIAASMVSLLAITLFFGIQRQAFLIELPPGDLWLAARAGTVGAFFSIALAIRTRTVLTNLRRRDNFADASLRIVIGVIAAGVLLLMIKAGVLPKLQIGDATIAAQKLGWEAVLIVGFIAGFSERLVPDLLAKNGTRESEVARKSTTPPSEAGSSNGAQTTKSIAAPAVTAYPANKSD